ncbi:MAG: hypothetical protein LBQ30_04135 [Treponema sp.]|jgi:hypothetical protein|nr:hypothetical protein [Treponema sp.]
MKRILPLVLAAMVAPVHAQTDTETTTTWFDTTGLPQWAKDVRRAEIVAFGSFPFTMFLATTAVDLYRSATHDWDTRYAPWPAKAAGAVDMTEDEQLITITAAALSSVVISLVDFFIVHYKRTKQARKLDTQPGEIPIIIRKPLLEENLAAPVGPEEP